MGLTKGHKINLGRKYHETRPYDGVKNPFYGKKHSLQTRAKMSASSKGQTAWNKGKTGGTSAMKGKKHTEETIKKISKTKKLQALKGENNPKWKGGYENKLWHNNKRRIARLGNGGSHTLGEWVHLKALYRWTCPSCWKKEPEITLSRDHITPISLGGSDDIDNIQPLCRSCNSKKHDKERKYEI